MSILQLSLLKLAGGCFTLPVWIRLFFQISLFPTIGRILKTPTFLLILSLVKACCQWNATTLGWPRNKLRARWFLYSRYSSHKTSLKKKIRITHAVVDHQFSGKDDDFHWKWTCQHGEILLTLDKDFLNNRAYPSRNSSGAIVLMVPPPVTDSKVNIILGKMLPILKLQNREYFYCKKIIANLTRMTIQTSSRSGGFTSETVDW